MSCGQDRLAWSPTSRPWRGTPTPTKHPSHRLATWHNKLRVELHLLHELSQACLIRQQRLKA